MVVYIPTIFFLTAFAYSLLIFGYKLKDYLFLFMGSTMCLLLGIYAVSNGVQDLLGNNLLVVGFTIVNIAIGCYVLLKGGIEFMNEGLW